MIFNKEVFDLLQSKYHVHDIETRYEALGYNRDDEVTINLPMSGFRRLVEDLFEPEAKAIDISDVFEIAVIENPRDRTNVYVARHAIDKCPLETIVAYGEQLRTYFESKGHKLILMPKTIDVSVLGIESLTQMRDELTELIKSLRYDNIIGF